MLNQYFSYCQKNHKSAINKAYDSINFDGEDFIDTANKAVQELSKILIKDKSINLSSADLLTLANELLCCHS